MVSILEFYLCIIISLSSANAFAIGKGSTDANSGTNNVAVGIYDSVGSTAAIVFAVAIAVASAIAIAIYIAVSIVIAIFITASIGIFVT